MENYESLGMIGEGTYGVVMKARHRETGQLVAIKKFKESDEDEQVRKTSLREVRVLKQLRHDNVITLLEVFRRKGKLYLVFEYVEKTILEVLEAKMQKHKGLDDIEVKKYMFQLLRGVEYCHQHNIIHRDIKPENILVSKSGALKLCDFGFARAMSAGGKYTDYVATRWYRSPELLVGDVDYGKGVDVWAIGCIFAELSTGQPLFPGESDLDQLAHIMRCTGKITARQAQIFRRNPLYSAVELPPPKETEPLEARFPDAAKNWLSFLKGCLRNDPEQRENCTSLLQHPYFQDKGFAKDFEGELRMLFEREMRANVMLQRKISSSGGVGVEAPPPAPPPEGTPQSMPVVVGASKSTHSPATPPNMTTMPPVQMGTSSQPGSSWAQYLQSTYQAPQTPQELPDLSSSRPMFPPAPGSTLPLPAVNKSTDSGFGQQLRTSNYQAPQPPSHHMYQSSAFQPESLLVSGSGSYGYHGSKEPIVSGLHSKSSSGLQGTQGQSSGTPQGNIYGGLAPAPKKVFTPTPASSSTSGLSFPSLTGVSMPGLGISGMGSQMNSNAAQSSLSAQLAYKKKPQKRNVLSTLSLTAFGAQSSMQEPMGIVGSTSEIPGMRRSSVKPL